MIELYTRDHYRPIIFDGDSVRAILAGAKTQARKIVKWPVLSKGDGTKRRIFTSDDVVIVNELLKTKHRHPHDKPLTPFGRPGDWLWVRETFRQSPGSVEFHYRADLDEPPASGCWRSATHLPGRGSRIVLQVEHVRIERLQSITEQDAINEGARFVDVGANKWGHKLPGWSMKYPHPGKPEHCLGTARFAFANHWNAYAKRGFNWDSNPWVWVIEFKRVIFSEKTEE